MGSQMSSLVHGKLLTKTNKPSARVQQKNFRQFKIRKTKTKCKPKRKEPKQKREKRETGKHGKGNKLRQAKL